MVGVTAKLKDLAVGEVVEITGTSRANLYMLAKRVGIKVSVEKFAGGFYVTRRPDDEKRPEWGLNDRAKSSGDSPKRKTIANLQNLISNIESGKEKPAKNPEIDENPTEFYVFVRPAWDEGRGEYYAIIQHPVTGKEEGSRDPKWNEFLPS